jgi:hypothetical protein
MASAITRSAEQAQTVYDYRTFYVTLSTITAADVITDIPVDYDGEVVRLEVVVGNVAVTTASKAATLDVHINATAVTGATAALTSATMTPKGAKAFNGTATAAKKFTKNDTLSLVASSVTAFGEGDAWVTIVLKRKG